jgi:hypothetical protein
MLHAFVHDAARILQGQMMLKKSAQSKRKQRKGL